tara:strand:+ start:527 stop:1657 length:1131 start_codon:yes stop_codon:yes gene_type:complete
MRILISTVLAIGALSAATAGDPFSIVSMTLHDEALSRAHDVELSGTLAFVPGKDQSLAIIDVSDPANPEIIWYKHDSEIPDSETVLPLGDHLLLGTRDFLSIDISDPGNPKILKKIEGLPAIDKINGMILVGDHAITANKSGFITAFDVSDLKNPILFGAFETKDQFQLDKPHDIDRHQDHIIIVDPAGFAPPSGKLGIFKAIENNQLLPVEQWTLQGTLESEFLIGANRIQVSGSYAIVCGSFSPEGRDAAAEAGITHLSPAMTVINISDVTDPKVAASLPFPDFRGPNGLTLAGKVAFCAGGQAVAAYDISDPEAPTLIGAQSFPRYKTDAIKSDNYHDLIYRDGLLYVSAQCDNGFLILKVEDQNIRKLADSK